MGSIFRVPFVYVPDLAPVLEQMHAKGIYTYAAHLKVQKYYDSFSFREPTAFLIGNEGNGLSKEISDQAGQIGRRRVGKECRSRWSPYH